MEPAYLALGVYVLWTLLWMYIMAGVRFYQIKCGNLIPNLNPPLQDNVPDVLKRLVRVYGNALENIAPFAGVVAACGLSGNIDIVNGAVWYFMGARILQSIVQAYSSALPASIARGVFFVTQQMLLTIWSIELILRFIG